MALEQEHVWQWRELEPEDMNEIMAIDREAAQDQSNEINGGVKPYTEDQLFRYLSNRSYWCVGIDYKGFYAWETVAFMLMHRTQIETIAVRRDFRRKSIGTGLIRLAKAKKELKSKVIFTILRESNKTGWEFLLSKENGFHPRKQESIARDHFKKRLPDTNQLVPVEDGYIMEFDPYQQDPEPATHANKTKHL